MTIKLLAHILRGSPLAAGAVATSTGRSLDLGRWVFEELVVRRWDAIGWRRQQPPARPSPPRADAAHGETTWSDTQPWCHR